MTYICCGQPTSDKTVGFNIHVCHNYTLEKLIAHGIHDKIKKLSEFKNGPGNQGVSVNFIVACTNTGTSSPTCIHQNLCYS